MMLRPFKITFFLLLSLLCLTTITSSGQAKYQLFPLRTSISIGLSGAAFSAARIARNSIDPLTPTQISEIQLGGFNDFDRIFSNGFYHVGYAHASDVISIANLVPLAFYVLPAYKEEYLTLNIMAIETFAITAAITQVVKVLVKRPRPFLHSGQDLYDLSDPDARLSFFSGHTSAISATSFFLAQTIIDMKSITSVRKKGWIYAGAIIVPGIMGSLRIASGKHFMTDVLTGLVVGSSVGLLVPMWHRVRQ